MKKINVFRKDELEKDLINPDSINFSSCGNVRQYAPIHGGKIKYAEDSRQSPFWPLIQMGLYFLISLITIGSLYADDLYIGVTTVDVSPELPIALDGQMYLRIAQEAETPLKASVIVMETRIGGRSIEYLIFVSCELVSIPLDLLVQVRKEVQQQLPELDVNKIVINATHTHTAAVVRAGIHAIPKKGVTQVEAYYSFFVNRVSEAIVQAWKSRAPGSITWGLSHAKVANNRRAVYADGSAKMYGKTNIPEFRGIEGYEDQSINTLFFWDKAGKLIAISIDVACPAQEVESRLAVNADYWHPVRVSLRKRFGQELCVMGWIGAAGDQSPHLMYSNAGEERMLKLRKLDRLDEIARRIVSAVIDAYEVVNKDRHDDIRLIHKVEHVPLPMRVVLETEYESIKKELEEISARMNSDPKIKERDMRLYNWNRKVIMRYDQQKVNPKPVYKAELHIIRIGDVVICTNPFELFTDFGIAIQARSKAVQTFVVQLVGPGSYVPTEKAVRGGHYSAIVQSNLVGPEGGHILVDRTVNMINEMFPDEK